MTPPDLQVATGVRFSVSSSRTDKICLFVVSENPSPDGLPFPFLFDARFAVHVFSHFRRVLQAVTSDLFFPDWVLLFQDRPFQYAQNDWLRLLEASPLTRGLVIHSLWCSSEPRTARPLPGLWRISQTEWQTARPIILDALADPRSPLNTLPVTAAPEEFFSGFLTLCSALQLPRQTARAIVISLYPRQSLYLVKLLEKAGWHVEIQTPDSAGRNGLASRLIIYDCQTNLEDEEPQIGHLRQTQMNLSHTDMQPFWLILAGFPDDETANRLQKLGIHAILPKPTPWHQFWGIMNRLG